MDVPTSSTAATIVLPEAITSSNITTRESALRASSCASRRFFVNPLPYSTLRVAQGSFLPREIVSQAIGTRACAVCGSYIGFRNGTKATPIANARADPKTSPRASQLTMAVTPESRYRSASVLMHSRKDALSFSMGV